MNHTAIQSSNILRVGYDPEKKPLEVHFKNGIGYRYAKVPPEIYADFLKAESPGSHFHQHIRSQYEGVKLTEPK